MANPIKDKNVFPDEEYAPVKPLYTKKMKMPYGTPGVDLKEVEREVSVDEADPLPINEKLQVLGKRTKRTDAIYKVTGAAKYTADIQLPGMLYGKFVRSTYPHARIRSVDTSEAERYPGVHAVHILTTEPLGQETAPTGDKLPVARFVGQPIAAHLQSFRDRGHVRRFAHRRFNCPGCTKQLARRRSAAGCILDYCPGLFLPTGSLIGTLLGPT